MSNRADASSDHGNCFSGRILDQRESGRGRRFTAELRRQIAGVRRWLRSEGTSWNGIGTALGLPMATVRRLCDSDAPGFVVAFLPHSAAIHDQEQCT